MWSKNLFIKTFWMQNNILHFSYFNLPCSKSKFYRLIFTSLCCQCFFLEISTHFEGGRLLYTIGHVIRVNCTSSRSCWWGSRRSWWACTGCCTRRSHRSLSIRPRSGLQRLAVWWGTLRPSLDHPRSRRCVDGCWPSLKFISCHLAEIWSAKGQVCPDVGI